MLWEKKGPQNTASTVKAALDRARELGIKHLVVASNSGETAGKFLDQGVQVVCVTHHVGFAAPGENEMTLEKRQELQEKGAQVLTTTHLLAGVDRALRLQFGGVYPAEIIASALRMFGQGVKVCIEIASMALDAGLIPYGEEIISVAGSARGGDAACVIVPAHSNDFFKTVVKEIICMPREK
ncbi:MAG: pyruvate kinase alpha/beta domain-containing protein [Dethiobacteria bacterium]